MVSKAWDQVRYGWEDWFQDEILGIPSQAIQLKAANLRDELNDRKRKGTKVRTDIPLKGVGYKGKEGTPDNPTEIGGIIPQGPVSSVKADTTVLKEVLNEENKLLNEKSIASTNARASLINAARGQAAGKGSVGKNLLTLQKMREEQNPVAQDSANTTTDTTVESLKDKTKGVDWKALSELTKDMPDPMIPTIGQGDPNRAIQARMLPARLQAFDEQTKIMQNPNYTPPPNQPIQQTQQQQQQSTAVTLDDRIQGAASSAAMAGIKMMINKIMEPKKGTDGAYEGGGAISGGKKPWEEMYIPQWYV